MQLISVSLSFSTLSKKQLSSFPDIKIALKLFPFSKLLLNFPLIVNNPNSEHLSEEIDSGEKIGGKVALETSLVLLFSIDISVWAGFIYFSGLPI